MHSRFSLFQSHLDLAHSYWRLLVKKGDTVIDATCGNGYDTALLAHLALTEYSGALFAFDIQPAALEKTKERLYEDVSLNVHQRVSYLNCCHSQFERLGLLENSVKLIVYNLGYLPGGDKSKTTLLTTTLASIEKAQKLIMPGGAISITCYPGHTAGKIEEEALMKYVEQLSPFQFSCCCHRFINRSKAPSLLLIQKSMKAYA